MSMDGQDPPEIVAAGAPSLPRGASGKTFVWCSEREALACVIHGEHAHIVIRSPGEPLKRPQCGRATLSMAFADLGERAPEPYRRQLMTAQQARDIVTFVEANDVLIIVNCEAGVCRSPGVVLALRRHYGGDEAEVHRLAVPNIYVTSLVTRALKGMLNE